MPEVPGRLPVTVLLGGPDYLDLAALRQAQTSQATRGRVQLMASVLA